MYSWYPIPTSLHKILVHGHAIVDSFSIPIGQLSNGIFLLSLSMRSNSIIRFSFFDGIGCSRENQESLPRRFTFVSFNLKSSKFCTNKCSGLLFHFSQSCTGTAGSGDGGSAAAGRGQGGDRSRSPLQRCPTCGQGHQILKCPVFIALEYSARVLLLMGLRLCLVCGSNTHGFLKCRWRPEPAAPAPMDQVAGPAPAAPPPMGQVAGPEMDI